MASLITKTVKGKQYWYLVESQRVNGKVKQVVLEYIGNQKKLSDYILKAHDAKLPSSTIAIKSYQHGSGYALYRMALALGVEKILDTVMPQQTRNGVKRSTSLLLAAIHRAVCPGSKMEFSHWFERTTLPYYLGIQPQCMTSQHFWEQMDGITESELRTAEDALTKILISFHHASLEKIALDYTNYFTYVATGNQRNTLAKRGENKQKRNDLRQCSLAIVTSKELGIPLFSHVYEGNRNDQTEFQEYLQLLKERMPGYKPTETTLVFDGGSNTKKNLEMLDMHYICSFSLSYCKELYEIDISDYENLDLGGKKVDAYRITKEIWGTERECVLTFSKPLFEGQARDLERNIEKALDAFSEMETKIRNPKSRISKKPEDLKMQISKLIQGTHLKEIIQIELDEGEFTYKVDEEKKQEVIRRYFGKKLLITDQKDWTTEEIISSYYDQDCIEKLFRDTKDTEHFSMRPLYHWTDQKIRVHIFICLLGLTLTATLQKKMAMGEVRISKDNLIEELSGIRECWIKDGGSEKVIRKLEEMEQQQKELWKIVEEI